MKPWRRELPITSRDAIMTMLSPYQLRALKLMASGASQAKTAAALGKTGRSINQQIELARLHLGCTNTYQLIAIIVRSGAFDESRDGTAA